MISSRLRLMAGLAALCLPASMAHAAAPLRGTVLEKFTGAWTVTGPVMGQDVCNTARIHWVLADQFLELELASRTKNHPYVANIYIGGGPASLSIHWLDQYGADFAKTLGAGTLTPTGANFSFPYQDGSFHDQLTYDATHQTWRLLITTGAGPTPKLFSDWTFSRHGTCPKG